MNISYGITVYNEADELNKLLEVLVHKTNSEDEIIVCIDDTNGEDDAVSFVLDSWTQQYAHSKLDVQTHRHLEGLLKSFLKPLCRQLTL